MEDEFEQWVTLSISAMNYSPNEAFFIDFKDDDSFQEFITSTNRSKYTSCIFEAYKTRLALSPPQMETITSVCSQLIELTSPFPWTLMMWNTRQTLPTPHALLIPTPPPAALCQCHLVWETSLSLLGLPATMKNIEMWNTW